MHAPTRTRTSNVSRTLLLVAGIGLLGVGCSKSPAESGIEKAIEAQSGGKVDLDSNGDGGFSMKTEDGEMKIDKDGNFTITDADGNVVTGRSDGKGNVSVSGDDGDVSVSSDGGELHVSGDDGEMTVSQGKEIPAQWPADVPRPDGLIIQSSTVIADGDSSDISLVGQTDAASADFVDAYGAALESNGFDQVSSFDNETGVVRSFDNGTWAVSIIAGDGGDGTITASITLVPSDR